MAVTMIVLARVMGSRNFVIFSVSMSLMFILTRIIDAGFSQVIPRFIGNWHQQPSKQTSLVSYLLFWKVILASALLLFSLFFIGKVIWRQVGIVAGDNYMAQRSNQNSEDIIISSSPFVWGFYREGNYQSLPFTYQDMINDDVRGVEFDSSNLFAYYQEQIKDGKNVYLSTVGFGSSEWPILDEYIANGFLA